MSTIIYRCMLNREMKRFGKFAKDIVQNLAQKGHNIALTFDAKRQNCIGNMQGYDTIVIIAHGNDDIIYHRYDKYRLNRIQPLISHLLINKNPQSVNPILNNKKVIAISCRTARKLGDIACKQAGCRVFLGFYNQIHFDKIDKMNEGDSTEYYHFLLRCYKETFKKILEMSIENNWTFAKLAAVLKIELGNNVVSKANEYTGVRSDYYRNIITSKAVLAVSNVANNIVVYGDSEELVG